MPIETPEAMRSRVPPSTRLRGSPRCRAYRSQAAISTTAFAEAAGALAVEAHNDEMFLVDAAETGFEEVDERELHEAQLQAFDPHGAMISSGALQFRYIAIEGAIGAGKTALAERLGTRLDTTAVLEDADNPFLADFYADKPGASLQAQLFYLLNRHRQLTSLQQADLFSQTTSTCES